MIRGLFRQFLLQTVTALFSLDRILSVYRVQLQNPLLFLDRQEQQPHDLRDPGPGDPEHPCHIRPVHAQSSLMTYQG